MFEDTADLLKGINLGEDASLELKAVTFRSDRSKIARPTAADLSDALAAMANSGIGTFVLGVDHKTRDIVGIPLERLDDVERHVREACHDCIVPPLAVHIIRLELPDTTGVARPVLKVEVPRSLFVHRSPGGYFQRTGSSKREMSPDVLARLFQQRSQAQLIRFEEQAVPDTSSAELEETLWRRFVGTHTPDPVGTLHKLKLLSQDDSGLERATVAGVLMCARQPERWLPSAYVEAVHYRGVRQDSNYQVDASQITGPLDRQILESVSFVRRNMTVAAVKTPQRVETPQFSTRAVFEAVVNAVAHRDYSIHGSKVRLFMFDDRLDLYSPGPLPNTVRVEDLAVRQSTRNELLTTLLARSPVGPLSQEVVRQCSMEKRGDGVPVILAESEKLSGRQPVYRLIGDAELLLTIWSAQLPNQDDETDEGDSER